MDQSTGAPRPHSITVERTDDATLVVLRGEIDAGLRSAASDCMVGVIAAGGPVVVDTTEVSFIDSSGMAFLLQLHRVVSDAGRHVVLRDPSGIVTDLLALVGLPSLFLPGEPQGV